MVYDKVIIGAGFYGLYAAIFCAKRDQKVLVLEYDDSAFSRATYINQARVHMGYHYPRSLSTAVKSAGYFERFNRDYSYCINREFRQIYATSARFSWSSAVQFVKFCEAAGIPCEEINPSGYFKPGMCDGAFLTTEYTYDAMILRDQLLKEAAAYSNLEIRYGTRINDIRKQDTVYEIVTDNAICTTPFLLNASYASTNQILRMAEEETFKIKYELCEIILCDVDAGFREEGITVMDGPFFSIMPFGQTGLHSLTAVTFTPHSTSYEELPSFACQNRSQEHCTSTRLGNCNSCPARPETAFPYMANLAGKYMREELSFRYRQSLFSMKPILKSSEVDDSRPTVIKQHSVSPVFVSVLSGKINTVYDLEDILCHEG